MDDSLLVWLLSRGADGLQHPGGVLLAHLQRTAARLESWGAERPLVLAGGTHAAYGTHGFPHALVDVRNREELRARIGDEAEAIVYAYGALDRARSSIAGGELRDRFGGEYSVPSRRLRHCLAELTVANELDVAEHGGLDRRARAALLDELFGLVPYLSLAGSAALARAARDVGLTVTASSSQSDRDLAYRELGGAGPRVLFWHGGAGPELTWSRQLSLSADHRLRIPWRRGFAPSAPARCQDWDSDARDLLRVLCDPAHVVAHSYGGVSALVAASRAPGRFASLVVIEAPLFGHALRDPEVRDLVALSRAFASGAPEARDAFLALAGLSGVHEQTTRIERLARGFRDPTEASPDLASLRRAGLPIAIVSGAHNPALERICDVLATELSAERWVLPGAGHAVQRVAEFNTRLRGFVAGRCSETVSRGEPDGNPMGPSVVPSA